MVNTRPSMQQLIAQRRRRGFVGRGAERAAFRENLELPPEDERHRFLFHVHGNAGVGKTFLVRELEQLARERGALTAYVDESVGSVPEAMGVIAEHFVRQGHRFKELERLLATQRERRHEAAAVVDAGPEPGEPSAASMAAARASLVGLGLVPGVGAFAGALDPAQLAQGADRLRAGMSARFRSQEDVQLVLAPERVLTPVLLKELAEAAAQVPWLVLVFDTYERTGPFLDGWLHDVMTTDRYGGALPANVVVVIAGQHSLDPARWGGLADFVTEVPLGPFTEAEARGLLAEKGVVAEPVVEEVLRLTGGLPVLVSTLAEQRPADPDGIGDPSATAVARFLKWEQDPVRRAAALACALPRRLDADVFRAAVDCPDEAVTSAATAAGDTLFGWLRGLPFVDDRGDRVQYHDLVREPMLRLQRRRSPRGWTERHERLAGVFGRWCAEAGSDLRPSLEWEDEEWRELRLEEVYHSLCARPRTALAGALRDVVAACREDQVLGRHWARMLEEAGVAAAAPAVRDWGRDLREVLADAADGLTGAMDLLLARPGLDQDGRAVAHGVRGRELRKGGQYARALAEYDRAIELDPDLVQAHYGRGLTHQLMDDYPAALAAFDRADELVPDADWILVERGETYRMAGRFEEAVADFDRAITLDPTDPEPVASRGVCRHFAGQYDEALADFDRALGLHEDYLWALVRRARLFRDREELDKAFADLDRAARLAPDSAWVASERGEAFRATGRFEEAVAELGRAVRLDPDHASALAGRGVARHELGRSEEALADLNRAIELHPDYSWALVMRARVRRRLEDRAGMFEDLRRAVAASPDNDWIETELGDAYRLAGRHQEAIAVFHRVVERDPDNASALASLGATHRLLKAYPQALAYLDRALGASPDYPWAYDQRARVCLVTGRTEQALADWDRCFTLDRDPDARNEAIGALIYCGRWDEALARMADADRAAAPDDDLDYLRIEAFRHTGRWAQARRLAERFREHDVVPGTFQLAMIESRSRGLEAAEPLWHELARVLGTGELDEATRLSGRCIVSWALADWADADRGLAAVLATEPAWDDLADLVDILTDLLHSPGADLSRLTPRLAAVTSARDAVRARYAH
jgi:tetratricopeptide (TPR) repeat protein